LARECIPTKTVIVRYNDKPWFTSEVRKEIRIRDRLRKVMLKYHRNSDICKYKKQRNRVNNLKKIAKGNFEINLDNRNTLPCQFEKCFGKLITHVIYIIKLTEEGYPVNYF
jgi:hypothetical protein